MKKNTNNMKVFSKTWELMVKGILRLYSPAKSCGIMKIFFKAFKMQKMFI